MFRPHVYSTTFRIGWHPILVSNSSNIAIGKPCPAPPAGSPEEVSSWAAPFGFSRPTVLGLAFPLLVELALSAALCEARNGYRLAAKRIPLVLEMEESARRARKAADQLGRSETDPKNEFGESALGRTAYPWGTAQTRYRSVPNDCREVHGSPAKTTIPDLAYLP